MRSIWIVAGLGLLLLGCNGQKKAAQSAAPSAAQGAAALNLVGTEWRLEELAGTSVVDNSKATLAFPEAGKIAGNGSCNRFFGTVAIDGTSLKLSPLGSTRMACLSEAVSNQETSYLKALQAATRYEWKDPYLYIYCDGFDKPLKFTKTN